MTDNEWILLESFDIPDSDRKIEMRFWPHDFYGGNRKGEHEIYIRAITPTYDVILDSGRVAVWNKDARARAYRELKKKLEELNISTDSLPSFSEIKPEDDLYSMKEFKDLTDRGVFIDYDGFAHYATENYKSNIGVCPSDDLDENWPQVVWYNR